MFKYKVASDAATQQVGAAVGRLVQPGSVIFLQGDLGAGKTTFTKGLASALGIQQYVKSPTFTLIREYTAGRIPLYHMDVYRLENGGGDELGLEEYFNGDGVSVVEWPQFIEDEWPAEYLQITINKSATNDEQRELVFQPQGQRYEALVTQLAQTL
ncbi:MAG: tRNA (adenosine(37)-N6)-threonylcarbamoyltransferase complex ATPase subunit type 1 TsaE [Loigolactobacillus coryniformis]|jgi:tRNA threonylcarbamoyladenosine biosynthesis protein TsaE|uniref:tRNA threonylcarbamoyladenosine biosynthesis protein TsaE n=1 Tax=Loigolactobacillus coryniformis subsp. coryniformis KCTC 3167 = DSM 20001 TaxID=913848 RepID=A0A0R1FDR7_9LACO|nr:tRNA (adenosine(37)-N6)-threonylcarbamoyltransferase complex ATPase subunit type 1 TsaE [Loigolactobacillus coryniformis]MDT3392636.1 tRNA (adenosine(37)-N6)-threonylcarbamoyltransferase complex ATPase subunit type 1 TsaE [Bacillota bacterium]ATO55029.1 tRNA (adenosine(37)-N6)-threonylcarbamoyltransferase complex ATPase subunit type 1 TsaE [Loigolactobacillus coryniformis subsp. coryniformis KCTC 3167 = DSM 20001]KRK17508.1 ATP GTP hydrolase [Loigolactobacillus coryniformis subsp. coryniformi